MFFARAYSRTQWQGVRESAALYRNDRIRDAQVWAEVFARASEQRRDGITTVMTILTYCD
jgi:hypothetical protein